jgi:hypothetical protein
VKPRQGLSGEAEAIISKSLLLLSFKKEVPALAETQDKSNVDAIP